MLTAKKSTLLCGRPGPVEITGFNCFKHNTYTLTVVSYILLTYTAIYLAGMYLVLGMSLDLFEHDGS